MFYFKSFYLKKEMCQRIDLSCQGNLSWWVKLTWVVGGKVEVCGEFKIRTYENYF